MFLGFFCCRRPGWHAASSLLFTGPTPTVVYKWSRQAEAGGFQAGWPTFKLQTGLGRRIRTETDGYFYRWLIWQIFYRFNEELFGLKCQKMLKNADQCFLKSWETSSNVVFCHRGGKKPHFDFFYPLKKYSNWTKDYFHYRLTWQLFSRFNEELFALKCQKVFP